MARGSEAWRGPRQLPSHTASLAVPVTPDLPTGCTRPSLFRFPTLQRGYTGAALHHATYGHSTPIGRAVMRRTRYGFLYPRSLFVLELQHHRPARQLVLEGGGVRQAAGVQQVAVVAPGVQVGEVPGDRGVCISGFCVLGGSRSGRNAGRGEDKRILARDERGMRRGRGLHTHSATHFMSPA